MAMESGCIRICISYVITTMLLTCFIYFVISLGMRNTRGLNRLREEVDDIAHQLRTSAASICTAGKKLPAGAPPCPATAIPGATVASQTCTGADNRDVVNTVEGILKRKLAHIMDDLYNLKKQMASQGCQLFSGGEGGVQDSVTNGKKPDGSMAMPEPHVNFASEELGARILYAEATPIGGSNIVRSVLGMEYSSNPPVNLLRPSLTPGSCFGFVGSKGAVTIKLAREIFVESLILTHVPKDMTPDQCTSSAPRDFCVFGFKGKPIDANRVLVGSFVYNNAPRKLAQEFPVKDKRKFGALRLEFKSNHGNPNFTCIYRLQVRGRMR